MLAETGGRGRRAYLSWAKIYDYWLEELMLVERMGGEFYFDSFATDPHEPSCFGCGWRVPPSAVEPSETGRDAWKRAGGLLEKAHLVDHSSGGSDLDPGNYAALCRVCHSAMTDVIFGAGDRDAAIDWIMERDPCSWKFQTVTDCLERVTGNKNEWSKYIFGELAATVAEAGK